MVRKTYLLLKFMEFFSYLTDIAIPIPSPVLIRAILLFVA